MSPTGDNRGRDQDHPELPPVEEEIDLLDYIEVLVRWRWLIFWGVAIGVLSAYIFASMQPEVYEAEAIILPAEEQDYLDLRDGARQAVRQSFYLDILESIPTSQKILRKEYRYELDGKTDSTSLLDYFELDSIQQGISALGEIAEFSSERTGVITIEVVTRSPQLSAAVANQYINQLQNYNREKREERIHNQLGFIEGRVSAIQDSLTKAEKALVKFKKQNRNLGSADLLDPEQQTTYSRLNRNVNTLDNLLTTILVKFEVTRIEAEKKSPDIEVLNRAEPPEFGTKTGMKKVMGLGFAVGLVLTVFLAFVLEYLKRTRQSGRMEPILSELKKDADRLRRLFGKGV